MLSVSFDLAALAAMLISIVSPGALNGVDSLNSPTTRPIPGGITHLCMVGHYVKHEMKDFLRVVSRF